MKTVGLVLVVSLLLVRLLTEMKELLKFFGRMGNFSLHLPKHPPQIGPQFSDTSIHPLHLSGMPRPILLEEHLF